VDTIIVWHSKVIEIQLNLQENGNIYSWGRNENIKQLNPILIMNLIGVESVSCGYDCSFIVQNGEIWSCGINDSGQLGLGHQSKNYAFEKVKFDHKVKKFHSFGYHSIMLLGKFN
jgi:hypothetical protein